MKTLFIILSIFFSVQNIYAQNTIAKLKYEQAEEAFSKNDFLTSVAKLEEVQKLLCAVNPKIAYLRIMAQSKLIDEDINYLKDLKNNCAYYLKNYDNPNLEEKYKEVYLVSETLMQQENNADFDKGYYHDVTTKRYDSALQYYKKAATGYGLAMNNIGLLYEKGNGVNKDLSEAASWFRRAADKGNAWGLYYLGRSYYHGFGVTQNSDEALNYLLQSATKNNVWGMVGAADTYHFLLKDYTKAFEWYGKAAAKDHAGAMHMIGYSYINGLGVSKDPGKAVTYFEKAAAKGEPQSFFLLGWIYKNGFGVPVNYSSAIQWLQLAVNKDHKPAIGELADMYEKGLGVKRDKKKAQELRNKQAVK